MIVSCRKGIFFLVLINPILSLVLDDTSVYYFYVMGPAIFLLLLIQNCKKNQMGKFSILVTFFTAVSVLLAIGFTASRSDLGKINNHLFNYLDAVLMMIMLSEDDNIEYFKNLMINNMKFIKGMVFLINVVEGFLLITGRGYKYHYNWGGTFFHGTNSMPHTLSYLMVVTIIFICLLIQYTGKKIYVIGSVIPLYAIFVSGARATLLVSFFVVLVMIDMIFTQKQKNILFKIFIVVLVLLAAAFVLRDKIMSSDLWSKIVTRQTSGNSSAGRIYIWSDLLNRYIHSINPLKYILGQGDYITYYYNLNNPLVKVNVWAHSDFLQILVGKGLAGLICYLYAMFKCGRNVMKKNNNIYKYAVIVMVVMAAAVNGFYSYKDMMLALPFIVILARYYGKGKAVYE